MKPASRPVRVVVFDLDGTLVDSLPLVLEAIHHALEPFGSRPTADIFARLGGPPDRFLADLLPDPAHVPAAVQRMAQFHRRHHHRIQPFAGAADLLADLGRQGIRVGVWTGRDRVSTTSLIERHQLGPLLAEVLCGDDLPTHKPDPQGLLTLLGRLGGSPQEALLVGDADVDVLGGHASGVDTVLIRHARTPEADVLARCWRAVETPAEAYALVRSAVAGG